MLQCTYVLGSLLLGLAITLGITGFGPLQCDLSVLVSLQAASSHPDLGSVFTSDCTLDAEITHQSDGCKRCLPATLVLWSSRALTLFVQMQFFQCIVMSVLLYSGETWAVVKQHISPLAVFQMNWRCMGSCKVHGLYRYIYVRNLMQVFEALVAGLSCGVFQKHSMQFRELTLSTQEAHTYTCIYVCTAVN